MSTVARDGWRLAAGTLSVLPVGSPRTVDARVAGRAMGLAPVVGVVLGVLVAVPAGLAAHLNRSPVLVAALVVGALAWLTRGMHLDGLADVADGLGSGRDAEGARAVMKKSDIGPFGVVALVVALLAQVAAVATLLAHDPLVGAALVGLGVVAGRSVLPWLCTPQFPAATPTGLGAVVAGTTSVRAAAATLAVTGILGAAAALAAGHAAWPAAVALLALGGGQLAAWGLTRRCVRRLGGTTGDVYGACVETATTTALVVAALLL